MTIFYSVMMFILGSLLTSFYQLVAERIPKHESIMGRSHCDHCHKQLSWIDVIPIVGYLYRRGHCPSCGSKIKGCYPLFELLGGLLFVFTYLYQGFSLDSAIILIMYSVFFIEIISDLRSMIVIDRIWMIGLIPLIIIRIIQGTWITYLVSSLTLFVILFFIAYLSSKVFHKEALGGGDVKLFLFIGWLLNLSLGLMSLFLASIIGLIYGIIKIKKKGQVFPLVPFLFMGVVIAYFYGDWLLDSYLGLLGM